jgi:hypothetical protein
MRAAVRREETMTKLLALLGASTVALASSSGAVAVRNGAASDKAPVRQIRNLSLEIVGQFQNSPPSVTRPTHVHYGYLAYIRQLSVFDGAPPDETNALFTFYADASTPRVIANGPLRLITRIGRLTIYRDPSTDGNFSKPDSFRNGTPVLVADFRQQVVLNTVTGSFTAFHQNTIVSTRPFPAARRRVQLGRVGDAFRTFLNGHVTMPGPPSGFFGGYAVSG